MRGEQRTGLKYIVQSLHKLLSKKLSFKTGIPMEIIFQKAEECKWDKFQMILDFNQGKYQKPEQ